MEEKRWIEIYDSFRKRLREGSPVRMLLIGVFGAMFLNGLMALLPFSEWFPEYDILRPSLFSYPLAAGLTLYGILTPILEELLFRWFLFSALSKVFSFAPAALISSLIFGLYHGNMVQFLYAFLFGIILAFAYGHTGNLMSPILVHGAANSYVYLMAFFVERELVPLLADVVEKYYLLWNGGLAVIGLAGLLLCVRRRHAGSGGMK